MIPDAALITAVLSLMVIFARFSRMAKTLLSQLVGKNLIGSLRNGKVNSRPPQAVPATEK
jgi:hypothetical protein